MRISFDRIFGEGRGLFMARNEHHVVHNPNGGWDVKRNNAQRVSVHTETKAEAMARGR